MAFQVQLLGRFALRSATGKEIAVPSKKGQALIAVLALADGAPVPRERLTGLLWSERGETQARGSLRQALTALRRVFEGVAPSPLLIETDHVALDLDAAEVDAVAASALAAGGSVGDLERAAALYRGDFLAGLQVRDPAFDEWLAAERRRFQRQFLEMLGRLQAAQEAEGQERQAIATAERLLATDPLNESAHQGLMRLFARAGERHAALRQYQTCRETLERELGVSPDPATEALCREIRAGETPSARIPAQPAETSQAAAPTSAPLPLPDKPSIAVLPFANMSGDPEQDYFAEAVTDEIISSLSRFRDLFVISRSSTFTYKGRAVKPQQVGAELGVAYILEGSVQRAGERVRIAAQLVDAASAGHLWAERYDRELDDIFALQDELVGTIVATLAERLEVIVRERAGGKESADLAAYDLLLRGEQMLRGGAKDDVLEARALFEQAIARDPGSARAMAGLALSYIEEQWSSWTEEPQQAAERALALARQAVELDDLDSRAHYALAEAYLRAESNFEQAQAGFDKAMDLNPNWYTSYCSLSWLHALSGNAEEGIAYANQAVRLNPSAPYDCRIGHFLAAYTAGRYEEAAEVLSGIAHKDILGSACVAACYAQLGRDVEAGRAMSEFLTAARAELADYPGESKAAWRRYWARQFPFKDSADFDHLIDGFILAGLPAGGEPESAPLPLPDKPSIAVLPFANLSDDSEQDYFADGITNEIITELIRFRSLFVIGSTSSFHYKGQSPRIQDVGRELGVAYVVEGRVRKAGNRVRITAQLVEAATGQHIWAERYDRALEDIFAVQDEVTGKIVSTLAGHLEESESRRAVGKGPEDLAAYDCVLLGEQGLREHSMDGILQAREMFQRAIELDPGSARAHTGLARSYLEELWADWTTAPEAAAEQALAWAKKAVAIDELDGRARANLATAYYSASSDFKQAKIQFDKALELNPNDADAYCLKGWCHVLSGQGEQAVACTDQAMRLSPFEVYDCRMAQFAAFYTDERYEDAVLALGHIPDAETDVSALLAACYAQQGRDAEAKRAMAEFLSAAPADIADYPGEDGERWQRYWTRHFPFQDPAHLSHLIGGLIKAGLPVGGGTEAEQPSAKAQKPSIAVLPFVNLSDDPEQEYFADGMTRDLITELGRFSTVDVIAATTMFGFKGRSVSAAEISGELDARYVLEGSVEKADRRIRISAQLTDAESGQQVWGDRFDGDLGDLFEIRDEIMRLISSNLYQPLMEHGSLKARQKPAASADAYDLYLRALYHIEKPTRSGIEEAGVLCRKALEIDPDFALVYELLVWVHLHAAWNGWAEDPEPELQAARREAARGVALDNKDPYLRGVFGYTEVFLGNTERGLKELRAAVDLVRSDSVYRVHLGGALALVGRPEDALAVLEEAERLGPGYHVTRLFEGQAHFLAGRPEQALGCYEQFLTVLPEFAWAWMHVAACHVELGQLDSAREAIAKARRHGPNLTQAYVRKLLHAFDPAYVDRLLGALNTAGLPADEAVEAGRPGGTAEESVTTGASTDKPSIAVLPFASLSDDPEHDYFAQGLAEDIIAELGRFRVLFVISRHSSLVYEGTKLKLPEIGRELGAQYLVEGSVRRRGDELRISVELVEAATGHQLWAERFDRPLEDIFAVQDEIVARITNTLTSQVYSEELESAKRKPPQNLQAYATFIQARARYYLYTAESYAEARGLLERAIEIDPGFAMAYSGLAWVHFDLPLLTPGDPASAAYWAEAHRFAQKAVSLDDNDALGHTALGWAYLYEEAFDLAEAEFERATALNPNDADLLMLRALALAVLGDPETALELAETALRLNPHSADWHWLCLEVIQYVARRYDEALRTYQRRSLSLPESPAWHAATLAQLGRLEEAREKGRNFVEGLRKVWAGDPAATAVDYVAWLLKMNPFRRQQDRDHLIDGLRAAGLPIPGEGAETLTDRGEDKPTVAVLPFKNLSGDPEQDYFAEGITQDIVTQLARFGGLQVVARLSAFEIDPALEPVDASRRLQARYVVAGNVRKAGNRVRITAQLIDGESGAHLWAERYDRELEDIFAIQDEVVHAIAAALGGQVEAADTERALRKRPGNLAAYDYYLRGMRHFDQYSREDIDEGHRLAEKAVALDPTFARAQSLFGWFNAAKWWWDVGNKTHLDRAQEYASKAVTLDPKDSVCWGFLANIHVYRREFDLAEHCSAQALKLNPSEIRSTEGYGEVLAHLGRFEEALERLQQIAKLEPMPPTWYWELLGVTLYGLGRFADAAEAFRRMSVHNFWNHAHLAACYGQLGKTDKAQEHLKAYAADLPSASLDAFAESDGFYKNPEDLELWLDGLRKAGLK
jgi:TolB-like protein/Flp pilus assembly protein TadD